MMSPVVKAFWLKSFRIGKVFGIVMKLIVGYHNGNAFLHLNVTVFAQLYFCGTRTDLCVLRNQAAQAQGLYMIRISSIMLDNMQRVLTINNLF